MLRIGYTSNCLLVCFLLHTCGLTIDSPSISFPTSARTWPIVHRGSHDPLNLASPTAAGSMSTSELGTDIPSRCGIRWRQLGSTTLLLRPKPPRKEIAQKGFFLQTIEQQPSNPYIYICVHMICPRANINNTGCFNPGQARQ